MSTAEHESSPPESATATPPASPPVPPGAPPGVPPPPLAVPPPPPADSPPPAPGELDDRDRALVSLLAAGRSKTEAAAEAGCGVVTVYRRSRRPAFAAALSDARRSAFARPAANAMAVLPLGIERLQRIVADEEAPLSAVIRATEALANIAVRLSGHCEAHKLVPASEQYEAFVLDDLLIDPSNADHIRAETMARDSAAKSAATRRGFQGYSATPGEPPQPPSLGGVPQVPKVLQDRRDRAQAAVDALGPNARRTPEYQAAIEELSAAIKEVVRWRIGAGLDGVTGRPR